jgi:ribonuclease-3
MPDKTKDLEKIIKYTFKNNSLLKKSLTHKSYDSLNNNEKLEFLGDRVLGLIISQKLLEKFPEEKEGIIDKKFANLVNKKTCSSIAKKLNLKRFIFLGKSHKNLERSADKIVGNCWGYLFRWRFESSS